MSETESRPNAIIDPQICMKTRPNCKDGEREVAKADTENTAAAFNGSTGTPGTVSFIHKQFYQRSQTITLTRFPVQWTLTDSLHAHG